MSEKIDLEFSADDRDLTQKISQLNKSLSDLGNAGDMSKGLSDNLSAIRKNIDLMKEMTSQTRSARLEMERFSSSINTSIDTGSGNSRQRKKNSRQLSYNQSVQSQAQSRIQDSISIEQYARSKSNSRTISSFTRGYGNIYDQRTTDNGISAYQRAMSRYDQTSIRQAFNIANRDIGTANRGLTDSEKRISNTNASGGFVSANARNTAERNLSRSNNILTDNGRFQSASDYINNNRSQIKSNISDFGSYAQSQRDITNNANSQNRQLTDSEKEIVKIYQHKQDLLLEENKGLEKLNTRLSDMDKSYQKLQSTMSESTNAPTGGIRGALFSRSKNIANNMIFGTAATVGGLAVSGNSIINQEQPMTRAIGANNGTYNSRAAQLSAQNAGRQYGLTGNDMLTAEMAYMSGSGYTSARDMNNAGVATGMFAKLTGTTIAQSSQLTSAYSQDVNGGSSRGLKELQDTFYGSLKQAGLTNKSYSQASALSGILTNYGSLRGGDLTNSLANSQVEMQSALGSTGNRALQGANGANFMNQMSSSIIGQGANSKFMQTALMSMNPSKYNGSYQGYANIIDQTQNGLDGTNLKAIAGMSNMIGGNRSNSYFANMLKNNFGVNVTSRTAGDIQNLVNSGQLDGLGTKASAKKLQQAGVISEKQAQQMQQNSSDATYDKGQANFEKAATSVGNLSRNAIAYGLVLTHGSALLLTFGAAVTAATASLAKITGSNMLSDVIRSGASGGRGGGVSGGYTGGTRSGGRSSTVSGGYTGGSRASGDGGGRGGFFTRTGSRIANSRVGRGATSILGRIGESSAFQTASGLFTRGKNAGTSLLGRIGESSIGRGATSLLSKGAGVLSKYGGKAMGALGIGLGAYDVYNTIKQGGSGKKIGSGIGGTVGSIGGGALGFAVGGPIGSVIGSVAGQAVGSSVGKLIGSITDKVKSSNTGDYKKLSGSDEKVLKQSANQFAPKNQKSYIQSMLTSQFGYSSSNAAKYASKLTNTSKENVNVNVTGTVRHKGEVSDMSELNMSKNSVLAQIFAGSDADKTKKN